MVDPLPPQVLACDQMPLNPTLSYWAGRCAAQLGDFRRFTSATLTRRGNGAGHFIYAGGCEWSAGELGLFSLVRAIGALIALMCIDEKVSRNKYIGSSTLL